METEIKSQILGVCRKYFLRFGYSKVSMDELAREMAMSKKTIYIHFRSKKEILGEIFKELRGEIAQGVQQILEDTRLSFTEKLRKILIFTGEKFSIITPYIVADIERTAPDIWEQLKKMKQELAFNNIKKLVESAKVTGQLKAEINTDLLVLFYTCAIDHIRDSSYLNDFPKEVQQNIPATADKTFEAIVEMLFSGIVQS